MERERPPIDYVREKAEKKGFLVTPEATQPLVDTSPRRSIRRQQVQRGLRWARQGLPLFEVSMPGETPIIESNPVTDKLMFHIATLYVEDSRKNDRVISAMYAAASRKNVPQAVFPETGSVPITRQQ